jgi:hypothetical protein
MRKKTTKTDVKAGEKSVLMGVRQIVRKKIFTTNVIFFQ